MSSEAVQQPAPAPLLLAVADEFSEAKDGNFLKGCKWAPDGLCLLTCSEDATMRLFNLPQACYGTEQLQGEPEAITSVLQVPVGEMVYDYAWSPLMNSMDPASCFFATSSRDHPVHIWDAFTGELRTTFRSYNNVDEIWAPHSIGFSHTGAHLVCGFKNKIHLFDVERPGRNYTERTLNGKGPSQSGIVSSIAFSPAAPSVFACGTFAHSVGIYDTATKGPSALLQLDGGVTHMLLSPCGTFLYIGMRQRDGILCYDLRNLDAPIALFPRSVRTNQRIYFDLDRSGTLLTTGSQDGTCLVYDVTAAPASEGGETEPLYRISAHDGAVNGASINPHFPLIATASGQRHFSVKLLREDGEEEDGAHLARGQAKIWSLSTPQPPSQA